MYIYVVTPTPVTSFNVNYVCLTALELIRRVYAARKKKQYNVWLFLQLRREKQAYKKMHNKLRSSLALGIGNRNLSILVIMENMGCLEEIHVIDLNDPLAELF